MRRKEGGKKDGPVRGQCLMELYLHNLLANFLGLIAILALNVFTPLAFFRPWRNFIVNESGWKSLLFFIPFLLLIAVVCQYQVQRPIKKIADLIRRGDVVPEEIEKNGRRRLLNLPFIISAINLSAYFFVPSLYLGAAYLLREPPFVLVRAVNFLMVGLVVATFSFFLIEDRSRKTLVPLLFPEGRLTDVDGTIRISIRRRIQILIGAGTLNPMFILMVTLAFVLWETKDVNIPANQLIQEIFFFCAVLCAIFLATAFRLNELVCHSILSPIGELLRVINRIKCGDLTQKPRVVSNDELGVLGDAGREMIQSLIEKESIREAFGKYITPEIRDLVLAGRIPVNGEKREATLLFSDLRGFTSFVEGNDPEEVFLSMRGYFTAMQNSIRQHQGLVLQYVGDEIEAVFGVPSEDSGHAENALRAAIAMRKTLEELNAEREREGKIPFKHGIGIHTGTVLAGNTGSEDRLSYALVGDTVNLASRIQDLTKELQCDILVSAETVGNLKQGFPLRREPPRPVKGFSLPVTVYKVLNSYDP
jgi:adenylate cyclase